MAKKKAAPVASSAKAGDDNAPATQQQQQQQQQQAGTDRPTTQLGRTAAFLVPPPWLRRAIFVAVMIYLTPMLVAHWLETSTKIIRMFKSYTSGR